MENNEITILGEAIKNEKRLFMLRELMLKKDLTWTEIVKLTDEHFDIRLNPNTVSFHLKYLMDRGIIMKVGNHYIFNDKMRSLLSTLVR